jgi:mannonate dehydratase
MAGLYARLHMKLGIGLYRHQMNEEHYRFARQCGRTHVVAHLVDYFRSSRSNRPGDQPVGDDAGWGFAGNPEKSWTCEELVALKREINRQGLELEAIENFDPAHWHDVLLDGPQKRLQLENLKSMIRAVGKAGVPVIGYNFMLKGFILFACQQHAWDERRHASRHRSIVAIGCEMLGQ